MMNRPNFAGERSRKLGKSWTVGRGEGEEVSEERNIGGGIGGR